MLITQKRSAQKHPCLTSGGNGCRGFCGDHKQQGIHPAQPLLKDLDDVAQHLPVIHPLPTPFLGEQGAETGNLLRAEPKQWAITPLLLLLSWVSLSEERITPHMMSPDSMAWSRTPPLLC